EGRQSQFNKRIAREAFVFGDETFFQEIKRNLEALDFIKPIPARMFTGDARPEVYFVIAQADFADVIKLQDVARHFALHKDPNAHRVMHVASKTALAGEDLLFAQEIGANFTISGLERDLDLRAYVKRISLQAEQFGSNTYFAN